MLSEEMLLERAGNFTASENHRLMSGWNKSAISSDYAEFNELYGVMKRFEKKPLVGQLKSMVSCTLSGELINRTWQIINDEKPSQGLITYAEEKANEVFYYPDPSLNFSTAHTINGNEREEACMALLSEKTGINFVNTGEDQIHIHANEVGCTPDGVVLDDLDLVSTGAEAKCKSPLYHTKNMMIKNDQELMESAFDHFVQVQTAMLVTGSDHWYFANYNPFAVDGSLAFGYIIVERDNAFISKLAERITIAKRIKADFVKAIQEKIMPAAKQAA